MRLGTGMDDVDAASRLDQLLRETSGQLYGYAYLLTGQSADAHDLVQDLSVKALSTPEPVLQADQPGAYLKRMLTNLFLNERRRQVRLQSLIPKLASSPHVSDDTEDLARRDQLWHALQRLPRRQRAAVVFRYYDELSYDTIADLLQCPASTARSLVARGLGRLHVIVDELDSES
jgi:RNA polymerase sigma factor (sigma-70 family)